MQTTKLRTEIAENVPSIKEQKLLREKESRMHRGRKTFKKPKEPHLKIPASLGSKNLLALNFAPVASPPMPNNVRLFHLNLSLLFHYKGWIPYIYCIYSHIYSSPRLGRWWNREKVLLGGLGVLKAKKAHMGRYHPLNSLDPVDGVVGGVWRFIGCQEEPPKQIKVASSLPHPNPQVPEPNLTPKPSLSQSLRDETGG